MIIIYLCFEVPGCVFKFSFCSTLCPQKTEKKLSDEQVAGKSLHRKHFVVETTNPDHQYKITTSILI